MQQRKNLLEQHNESKEKKMRSRSDSKNYLIDDEDGDEKKISNSAPGLKGDRLNIALLLFLYILQGIPLGLGGSIPLILQNSKISYKDQAVFSFAHWPFSVKLLWAPIVDSLYVASFGRRKSWLVPSQYVIGIFMIVLSYYINSLLGKDSDTTPNVYLLTGVFFTLNFMAATQDIAVDGWALTMLSRRNVGYASTCNTVGQTAGYFLGNVLLLALESPHFSNTYLRSTPKDEGLVCIAGYIFFWGVVFLITTTVIMFVKKEKPDNNVEGLAGTYKLLLKILCLRSVVYTVVILLTAKIAFGATDAVTGLKLIELGVPKEHLAMLAVPLVPVQILLPIFISRYTGGPTPLKIYVKAYPIRCVLGILFSVLILWTPTVKLADGTFPIYYYVVILIAYALHQGTVYCVYVAMMAFFAKISDPTIGGTYMTLMNTVSNLGGNWPGTVALWGIDYLTYKSCMNGTVLVSSCSLKEEQNLCKEGGGVCETTLDGYHVETMICIAFGFLWLYCWGKKKINYVQSLPMSAWKTNPN